MGQESELPSFEEFQKGFRNNFFLYFSEDWRKTILNDGNCPPLVRLRRENPELEKRLTIAVTEIVRNSHDNKRWDDYSEEGRQEHGEYFPKSIHALDEDFYEALKIMSKEVKHYWELYA